MPSGISNSDLQDLLRTTLQNLPNLEFEVALENQTYEVCNRWFAKDRVSVDSGTSILRNILLDTSGNAKHVRLYQKTALNVADVQHQVTAPWVQVQSHYSIERREALRNRKPARYIELVKSRRIDGMLALADLLELRAWKTPETSSDDLNPRGLPYWLSKVIDSADTSDYDATIDVPGTFCGRRIIWGDNTTSLTSLGGINPTTEAKWRSFADTYTAVDGELIKKMRKAFHATKFQSPVIVNDLVEGPRSQYRIYMGLDEITDYEDLATKQNDNLGADLNPFHGNTAFKRVPVIYNNQLDDDDSDPIYAVNHAKFFPIVQDGDWMRESDPMADVEQHNVTTVFIDGSYQFFCTNRREAGFVIHKALGDVTA